MSADQRLYINVFGIELKSQIIYRHVIQVKLVDQKNGKDYILTTMSSRGRGNRETKQKDNFLLVDKLLEQHCIETEKPQKGAVRTTVSNAYDGAQCLFALEPIDITITIDKDSAVAIDGISEFLKDSLNFLNGVLEISCTPDCEKPSFNQVNLDEWEDPRFYSYLDIVTSQGAVRSGNYLSQSKGLYVYIPYRVPLRNRWAEAAKGVHKGCRIVGETGSPQPILELDPQSTQYYSPIPLDQMFMHAVENRRDNRRVPFHQNPPLMRALKLLFKDLKCNPFYADVNKWATNTIIVHDLDFTAPMNKEYLEQNPGLRFKDLPAALCGAGPNKKRYPLEKLRCLPFQSIDRRVLEEFDLTPRASSPEERWADLQNHFTEFRFKEDTVMRDFGVIICNDPFENKSEIMGDRVEKPAVAYARPVPVDDEKRDWKSRLESFSQPSRIDKLLVVLIVGYTRNMKLEVDSTRFVVDKMIARCHEKGVQIRNIDFRQFNGDEHGADQFLTGTFREIHQQASNPQFSPFVLLVTDDIPNIHEYLKFEERMCDVPTQHMLLKTVYKIRDNVDKMIKQRRPPIDLTMDNIIMKLNIKAGGLNYTADSPDEISSWKETPTFVVGLDVAHPDRTGMRDGQPSTVGLSCNSTENPYSFIGDFHYTAPRKEAIDDEILSCFIKRNITDFYSVRGFPKRVIIFRDGVSFGEEVQAKREAEIIEMTIIDAANDQGFKNYKPLVSLIVVKKRHNTRFYSDGNGGGGRIQNPLPDTSVGGDIAEYGKRELFIQAFRPVQGTAKIPSFLVLRDDEQTSDEQLSKMVCAVCSLHQYVNSPTSIPTPVYVAHELAKRGTGQYKAYRFKTGKIETNWTLLTGELSYSNNERLSKVRVY